VNIAYFLDSSDPISPYRAIRLLKEELEKDGHKVVIFTPGHTRKGVEKKNGDYKVRFAFLEQGYNLSIPMVAISKLKQVLKAEEIDLVHSFSIGKMGGLAREAAKSMEIKMFYTFLVNPYFGNPLLDKLVKKYLDWLLKYGEIIFPTELSQKIVGIEADYVLPLPISYPKEVEEKRKKYIISAGKLTKDKNLSWLINALPSLINVDPSIKYKIYGKGEEEKNLKALIKQLGLNGNVTISYQTDLSKAYQKAQVYYHASSKSLYSLSMMEAMSYGVVPLVYKDSAMRDVGLKDTIFEDKKDLTHVVPRIMEQYEELRERARFIAQAYDIKNLIQEYKHVYSV